jgi:DNA-binding transcriptional ArsR family regulator
VGDDDAEVAVLRALADPTRRRIVELLAAGDHTVTELTAGFDVSRPAVSRHLRVLREAGVVTSRAEDRRRVYRLQPDALEDVATWLARTRAAWTDRLDALEVELRRGRPD